MPKPQAKSKGKTKKPTRERIRRSPPLVWPEYSKGPTTIEEMREVERRQEEYIAYHGTYPWSTENLWGPDDDSSSEPDPNEELEGQEDKTGGNGYCPESLEDDDLLRAIEFALNAARDQQWHDSRQFTHSPSQLSTACTSKVYSRPVNSAHPPSGIESCITQVADGMPAHPIPVAPNIPQKEMTRLRPKNKLRKTEKAQKLYRS